ncbi:zinc ribbon domain-containing protein [Candidatus Stoquefichus massiliensis]|uniref:zinc ribbon domain-containing protein n=1 Tax=Candidatus Stoquefichus massiliensis TaxID=1470350 RepID=UPI0004889532|nr:zinc ribbon domain-containing protein [Candidatus Stoquefichus massiliensis]
MYCHQCGKEVNSDVKYCPYCGAQLEGRAQTQQSGYRPIDTQPYHREEDESSFGFALLSFLIPVVGLVLYLVWNKEYPLKAKSCLRGFIANIALYVIGICCMMSAFAGIASHEYDHDYYYNTVVETVPYE